MRAAIDARVRRAVERLAERVRHAAPGVRIDGGADRLTVTGRGVRDALGWIGGLLR